MTAYRDIPELADLEAGRGLIRVPFEQDVPFTDRVRAIVDTVEFQRLAQISQLGLVSRVYPGARHTRFEHALGVYHNALRFLRQLCQDARFVERVDTYQMELLIVAALLHDLGHWPYCHPIEDLGLETLPSHEGYAGRYLLETELTEVIERQWGLDPQDVVDVLVKKRSDSPSHRVLQSILSGPIDIDKMDYLERDSLHAGVPYGRNFDKNRLIRSLVLNADGDGLAITAKGKTAAELMVFSRYVMFSEVYWHHTVRAATSMFARSFYELHDRLDLPRLFASSDDEMIAAMHHAAKGADTADLLSGLFGPKRLLYKRLAEYMHSEGDLYTELAQKPYSFLADCSARLAEIIGRRSRERVSPLDLLIDAPPPHREVEFRVDLYFPKRNEYRSLRDVSPVVDALARTQFDDYVKRVRVFAAPALAARLGDQRLVDECLREAIAAMT